MTESPFAANTQSTDNKFYWFPDEHVSTEERVTSRHWKVFLLVGLLECDGFSSESDMFDDFSEKAVLPRIEVPRLGDQLLIN